MVSGVRKPNTPGLPMFSGMISWPRRSISLARRARSPRISYLTLARPELGRMVRMTMKRLSWDEPEDNRVASISVRTDDDCGRHHSVGGGARHHRTEGTPVDASRQASTRVSRGQ